jgi:hypothetical protein
MAMFPLFDSVTGYAARRPFGCALLLLSATYLALGLMENVLAPLGLLLAVLANPVASVAGETYYYARTGRPTAGRQRALLCGLGMLLPHVVLEGPGLARALQDEPFLPELGLLDSLSFVGEWLFAAGASAFWLALLDSCRKDDEAD